MKPLASFNFPFLQAELRERTRGTPRRTEKLTASLQHFEVIIETGQNNRTSPLVLIVGGVSAKLRNWSSVLEVVASLNLQAGYFNKELTVWEPLLEQVSGLSSRSPWELTMMMKKVMDESEVLENSPSAKMEIKIESSDTMELTVTRNFLDVISSLGKTFSDAANQKFSKRDLPYVSRMPEYAGVCRSIALRGVQPVGPECRSISRRQRFHRGRYYATGKPSFELLKFNVI